ncbi:tryptophan synthase beta subunit-like PLP-dependent enzyme [Saitoella complicata NRRL Y-17804]|uniref:L-serine ammonia-lyase n=1 Tax=Saitoella complicata (strain BCRC 22490 / CBS 7301 / JCM 7358 / NBRC 10748 / NRRL Y-17804) TaxID=698492 RepID=A0A0E9NNM0_SAICN|nr:tryptophan synthase beta subunit-like PLP-dependent enzyme [Saitoella complicata NRRL Y-17804]ODQ51802.1 tryptophan synthase beta subunit-like PLP-dependent enzyme [Saitoella complicata NRRL Y-17804]GAO51393.1 hypothetical protein G7K_5495-t1 [Saitoella complicata NRRL Y-17804]
MQPLYVQTPLVESTVIAKAAGNDRVYLKLENLQPSGSFKSRGIGNLCQKAYAKLPPGSTLHIYSSSGGNAGLAAASAASSLSCPATIVVPTTTSAVTISRIQDAGASVVVHGSVWDEADLFVREMVERDSTGVYCPPFDHEDIVDGNASMVRELKLQLDKKPGAIVCAVGGGGLLAGILHGLREVGWDDVPVVAVETVGAASFHASMTAGSLTTIPAITSIATSLGARRVSQTCFDLATTHPGAVHSVTVSDAEAVDGCVRFADDHRILVEPACGTVLSLAYHGKLREVVGDEGSVVLVVCGGSNVSVEMLARYQEQFVAAAELKN